MKRESPLYFIMVHARTYILWKESLSTHWKSILNFGLRIQMKPMSIFCPLVLWWSLSTSSTQLFVTRPYWRELSVIMCTSYPTNINIEIEVMELTISCFLVMIGYLSSLKSVNFPPLNLVYFGLGFDFSKQVASSSRG